jgi:hypothetical protein
LAGALLNVAKFRFNNGNQRFKGILEGWRVPID